MARIELCNEKFTELFGEGNSKETMIAAMIHCMPYIGFPRAFNAINAIKEVNYK